MHPDFAQHVESVLRNFVTLTRSQPLHYPLGNRSVPERGIYLYSEGSQHLYVGRSDDIRSRLNIHQRDSAKVNQAAFACLLAKRECGITEVSYRASASGQHYSEQPDFVRAFASAKQRIRTMDIRVVAEADPIRQALLELYAHVALGTPHNDFANH